MRPIDLASYPAWPIGEAYPCVVSTVDDDGNEIAGIRMPDVSVPVATHAGWNPRHPTTGAPGQLLDYLGSSVPFPVEADDADPRRSISERYRDREDYLTKIRAAAERLVEQRYLLASDVSLCERIAGARYDACVG